MVAASFIRNGVTTEQGLVDFNQSFCQEVLIKLGPVSLIQASLRVRLLKDTFQEPQEAAGQSGALSILSHFSDKLYDGGTAVIVRLSRLELLHHR